eukprot:NODE_89_length_21781_cov_0.895836.p21 type:complete len:120 gc:universal NODE_89_length_21781_cov_0.895836:1304-1663(+)
MFYLILSAHKISINGKCGLRNGLTKCPGVQYCSIVGYCGTGVEFKNGCQPHFSATGLCKNIPKTPVCGLNHNRKVCARGMWCSSDGFCGNTMKFRRNCLYAFSYPGICKEPQGSGGIGE